MNKPRVIARTSATPRTMNATEAAYASLLTARQRAGEVLSFSYESVSLRLGNDCRYTPDFFVVLANGEIEMHEVKGFMRDDAQTKLRTAAAQYPFRFILALRVSRGKSISFDISVVPV